MTAKFTELDIRKFIAEFWNDDLSRMSPDDIFGSLGIDGDDVADFMEAYQKAFHVDLEQFRWYFHGGEEGHSIGGFFFKPLYARVQRIPISQALLIDSANAGKWTLCYPEHTLPKRRYDILTNQILAIVTLLSFSLWLLFRYI